MQFRLQGVYWMHILNDGFSLLDLVLALPVLLGYTNTNLVKEGHSHLYHANVAGMHTIQEGLQ